MGRETFISDLRDAVQPGLFAQISTVTAGDDDGTLKFVYQPNDQPGDSIAIDAMVSDVHDYPSHHSYFLFTTSEGVPDAVANAIERIQQLVSGNSIPQMLLEVSATIGLALSGGLPDVGLDEDEASDPSRELEEENLLSDDENDEDMWFKGSPIEGVQRNAPIRNVSARHNFRLASKAKMRSDMKLAKEAGFKVGILGALAHAGVLCISIRVAKLGLSEEAMNAWSLTRNQYLVLLIRYRNGYKSITELEDESALALPETEFRAALCKAYKPCLTEAINAFNRYPERSNLGDTESKTSSAPGEGRNNGDVLEPLFIGKPLNELLKRLPTIIKHRLAESWTWTGAELFLREVQGHSLHSFASNPHTFAVPDRPASQALPEVVKADHMDETIMPQDMSLPLAAMQFVLRHLVRCTEFCLVCHCQVETDFEALKPYVCSKPLCFFQYLALGFGPSVEWEIMSQPYVVDLLISFCYSAAKANCLRHFPIGIDLKVPLLPGSTTSASTGPPTHGFSSKLDADARQLILTGKTRLQPLKVGDWVVLIAARGKRVYHAHVEEIMSGPIRLGELIDVTNMDSHVEFKSDPTPSAASVEMIDFKVFPYRQSFDELPDPEKQRAITCVLDALPDVMKMKALIKSEPQESLRRFRGKISDAALNILRWIIASNRSCIMQVDQTLPLQGSALSQDHVLGMESWMQFRFAQGAPDKEQRFMDCVKSVSARLGLEKYPTLFAWHGSRLANWHSIVREGLHFNQTAHGRAFGHGVYMSSQASTSLGFCTSLATVDGCWPNSKLRISKTLALNEVVNAPDEFVSQSPHYVVSQIDWIQARYLFVECRDPEHGRGPRKGHWPRRIYEQDPKHIAKDQNGMPIVIPISAVSRSRRPVEVSHPRSQGAKRSTIIETTSQAQADEAEGDAASVVTTVSDLEFLRPREEEEEEEEAERGEMSPMVIEDPRIGSIMPQSPATDEDAKTDFVPGTLQASTLPLLAPPANASSVATKTILAALQQTLSAQASRPLHELGWHISHDLITNIYQWPIELHSFPSTLPLASDMLAVGLKSIVLEMRFGTSFPMSPPFVRVIRPRFLPFMSGGGGHVTAGGALCMELLTNSGWSAASSIESVLLQVRMAISSTDPSPARLSNVAGSSQTRGQRSGRAAGSNVAGTGDGGHGGGGQYSIGEAVTAYKRACQLHGWQIPAEIDQLLVADTPAATSGFR